MSESTGSKASNWQAESLRMTLFLAPNVQPADESRWIKVTGTQPENSTAKPNRGELVEAGIFQGVNLTLSVQPGRIDWVVSPNLSQEDEPSGLKTLGEFGTVAKDFLSTVSNWLNSRSEERRVGKECRS